MTTRIHVTFIIIVFGCAGVLGWGASPSRVPGDVVFEHVRVLPMDSARALEDQTVTVRGGRIEQVGPAGSVAIPPGAMQVDGRGATLVPGLTDFHVHPYEKADLLNYLAYGVTSIVDLNGSPRSRAWSMESRSSSAPLPTVYTSGPALNGYPPGNPSFVSLDDPGLATLEVRRQNALGYDLIKAYSTLAPEVFHAVMDAAAEEGLTVVGHLPLQVGLEGALAAGQSMIAHGEELWKVLPRDDSARVEAAVEAIRASGARVTPNLSALDRIIAEITALPALMGDPEADFVPPSTYSEWMPSNNRYWGSDTSVVLPGLRAELTFVSRLTTLLSAAGVPLLLGTDSPVFGFAGASAHRELQLLVEAGLSPSQALMAATRSAGDFAAEEMGIEDMFGRIVPGYRADLLLVEGDPLADVTALTQIRGVMVRGVWWTRTELDARRRAGEAERRRLRSRVDDIDSLIVGGDVDAAMDLLDSTRADFPGTQPIAEVVLWNWGRRLLRAGDERAESARRVYDAMTRSFPDSHAAWVGLSEVALLTSDTATAQAALSVALELSPYDAGVRDRIARLEFAGTDPGFDVSGVYVLRTRANVGGEFRPVEMIVTLEGAPPAWTGRIETDTPMPTLRATSIEAGGDRLWISADLDGQSLDLRLTVEGSAIRGSWNLGVSEQGIIEGRRGAKDDAPDGEG